MLHTAFYRNYTWHFNLTADESTMRVSSPDYFKPAIRFELQYQIGESWFLLGDQVRASVPDR